jgi:hypothetical protein
MQKGFSLTCIVIGELGEFLSYGQHVILKGGSVASQSSPSRALRVQGEQRHWIPSKHVAKLRSIETEPWYHDKNRTPFAFSTAVRVITLRHEKPRSKSKLKVVESIRVCKN